jgi:hypothetical protein
MSAPDTSLPTLPQVNTSGMTSVSPDLTPQQPRGQAKFRGLPALAAMIVNKVQQRKHRETEAVVQQFVGNYKGIEEAKSQLQDLQKQNAIFTQQWQAATTPEMKQALQQKIVQSAQQARQLLGSMETNRQNLREMFNGPKQDKHAKIISKAFGIDDKNAGTPERQAAIKVIQDQMRLDQKTAQLVSMLPQRQQLSPEARAQQQMVQAGVVGKPATGGQQLTYLSRHTDQVLKAEKMANDVGLNTEKMVETLRKDSGLIPVRDEQGNIQRNPDNSMKTQWLPVDQMTPEEYAKYQDIKAQTDLRTAQAKAAPVRAAAAKLNSESMAKYRSMLASPQYIQNWARVLQDPTQKATIGSVPAIARGPILQAIQSQGGKLATPLSGDEIKRMDLATNALDNIEEMQRILGSRPDMFGPAGWMSTKFEQAVNGGDPDALRFYAAKNLANLPAVGVHGVRGKWALQDLDKLDGNLYLNAESMTGVLDEIHRSVSAFRDLAARPATLRPQGGSQPIYAINPKTKERKMSTDGGKTWQTAPNQ